MKKISPDKALKSLKRDVAALAASLERMEEVMRKPFSKPRKARRLPHCQFRKDHNEAVLAELEVSKPRKRVSVSSQEAAEDLVGV